MSSARTTGKAERLAAHAATLRRVSTFERVEAPFGSAGGTCAAWRYLPTSDTDGLTCIVMGNGFSLTRHDGLPYFAETFADAGLAVLLLDYRHQGDSPSSTPGRLRVGEQQADWRAAVASARAHSRVDPARIVLWGFSLGGGHVITLAAEDSELAATLTLCPMLDGRDRVLGTPPRLAAWITMLAVGERLGRRTRIPVTAQPGGRAALTLPGEADGFARSVSATGPWRNEVGPALFTGFGRYRPVAKAKRVPTPAWVALGGRDVTVSGKAIRRFADTAPRAELREYPEADHFDVLAGSQAREVAADQLAFLERLGLAGAGGPTD